MPVDPLRTDRTEETMMGPDNHPSDHNIAHDRINQLWAWMEEVIAIGGGSPGVITPEVIAQAVLDGVLTPEAIGALDASEDVVLLTADGRLRLPLVASDADVTPGGFVDFYGKTGGTAHVQVPGGKKTQLGPPWEDEFVSLAVTADIASETLTTILTSPTLATNARYRVWIDLAYECANFGGAQGGQLRNAFVVPGGVGAGPTNSKGSWHGTGLNASATGTSGTAASNFIRRDWSSSLDLGGRGAGNPTGARIEGTLYTGSTAGTFQWRARRAATDAVTARIYGDDNATGLGGSSMLLQRVA